MLTPGDSRPGLSLDVGGAADPIDKPPANDGVKWGQRVGVDRASHSQTLEAATGPVNLDPDDESPVRMPEEFVWLTS